MQIRTPLVLILAMVAQVAGNLFLSKGMKQISSSSQTETSSLLGIASQLVGSPYVWTGVLLLIVFFLLFTALLSWADLSFVLPASSFGYVLNVAMAHYFLLEPVSMARWCGTGVIVAGVIMVAMTGSHSGGGMAEWQGHR
jgi:uncharacterized membrane protein